MRLLKQLLHRLEVYDPARTLILVGHLWRRLLSRYDEALQANYFASALAPPLHIGSGWRRLPGWLNVDIALVTGVMQLVV